MRGFIQRHGGTATSSTGTPPTGTGDPTTGSTTGGSTTISSTPHDDKTVERNVNLALYASAFLGALLISLIVLGLVCAILRYTKKMLNFINESQDVVSPLLQAMIATLIIPLFRCSSFKPMPISVFPQKGSSTCTSPRSSLPGRSTSRRSTN